MIDHILLDVIGALRGALEGSLLERLAEEERFAVDVFVGDVSFGTSYGLPGERDPSQVRADISLEWSTWSQATYRSWSIGEPTGERPDLVVELAFRLDDLIETPDVDAIVDALGRSEPRLGPDVLARQPVLVEHRHGPDEQSSAVEIAFGGAWHLVDSLLEDPAEIERALVGLAAFTASALVRLADLGLTTVDRVDPPAVE